eukprot:scaffold256998_cov18-Tisochrysis_lutea.AAC.1
MAYTQGSPLASTGCCSDHHLIRALRTWVSAVKSLENRVSGYQDDHAKQRVVEVGVAGKLLRSLGYKSTKRLDCLSKPN